MGHALCSCRQQKVKVICPVVEKQHHTHEYGIRLDPAKKRQIIDTNFTHFLLAKLSKLWDKICKGAIAVNQESKNK